MDAVAPAVRAVMHRLEERDATDRMDGTLRSERLRAITSEVGQLLFTLALAAHARTIVEIGTSVGYSTLWLATAARRNAGRVITFEIDPAKVIQARATFAEAGVEDVVELRAEDALSGLEELEYAADLVFLDAEKEDYEWFLQLAVDTLETGGLLVADNLTSHAVELTAFREKALAHPQLTGLVVPVGRGELVAVKLG
jgi:predicted O-methyltransferase YrrM